jgi:hypothetical protein
LDVIYQRPGKRIDEGEQETDNSGKLPDLKGATKPPSCLWVKLVFGIVKTLIGEKVDTGTLTNNERNKLKELTTKSVISSKKDIKTINNLCDVRYKYIIGATEILNITQDDFPERKDLFCEVLRC